MFFSLLIDLGLNEGQVGLAAPLMADHLSKFLKTKRKRGGGGSTRPQCHLPVATSARDREIAGDGEGGDVRVIRAPNVTSWTRG